MRTTRWLLAGSTALALAFAGGGRADACGCFTPPDPSVPVVQAGERLLFSVKDGEVTAHIQIQYAGAAGDFGWILPLPTQPTLELGTDEVFNQLIATTQPKYHLDRVFHGNCDFGVGGRGQSANFNSPSEGDGKSADPGPQDPALVVIQASVGPYDYAVLHGDKKDDMLNWLAQNRYFVPAGTDDVVSNYIYPGAYFLALKLHPGATTGDLQPVVVHYNSDLPMIPIVLSSVTSQKNVGIQVWMLGNGRAIPRNYYHTVVDDAAIDWLNAGTNYNDVIIRAANEAPGHHTFVTEFAGDAKVMRNVLDAPNRFGSADELKTINDPVAYVGYMLNKNFPLDAMVTNILGKQIPEPSGIAALNVKPAQYYQNLSYWLGAYRLQHPQVFERTQIKFDPITLTDELFTRVVAPTLAAGALFQNAPYMTRLYTTLSPEDMTRDPVFSYNPELPDVPNVHDGTLTYECGYFGGLAQNETFAWLSTADGFAYSYPNGTKYAGVPSVPASRFIQMLRETGQPELVVDNTQAIASTLGDSASGCSLGSERGTGPAALSLLFGAALLLVLRRRSRG
jgi:hypothetical protein